MSYRIVCDRKLAANLLSLGILFTACSASAAGREDTVLLDRFQLRLGAFLPDLHSSIESSVDRLPGDRLDFESDLGLDDSKTTFYGGISWRFAPRQQIELEYFDLERDGRNSNEREWNIGDKTLLVGGQIQSRFDVQITRLSYQYTLYQSETQRVNVMGGIHHAQLEASLGLAGEIQIDGVPVITPPGKTITELSKTDAPLPHFGLSYGYSWSPDWSVHASGMAFGMTYDNYEGALYEFNLSAQYQINRYLGFGAGYKRFSLEVERSKKGKVTDFDFDYSGPAIFLTATF